MMTRLCGHFNARTVMIKNRNRLHISLDRSVNALETLRKQNEAFFIKHDYDEVQVAQYSLAVYELAANIVEHGGSAYARDPLDITWTIIDQEITITVEYRGTPFDITKMPLPDLGKHAESGKDGGLGIYMIRTIMDVVKYSRTNQLNTIVMIKKQVCGS